MKPKMSFTYPFFDMLANITEQSAPYRSARLAEHTPGAGYCPHSSTAAYFSLGRVNSPRGGTAPGRSAGHNLMCVHMAGHTTMS